jgi:hypothetical protein
MADLSDTEREGRDWQAGYDPDDQVPASRLPAADDSASLLESLGALREVRVSETQEDMPFPDTGGRLWGRFKLTKGSTRAGAVIGAGVSEAMGVACDFIADACVCLYLAHGIEDDQPLRSLPFPGCESIEDVSFSSPLEDIAPRLCPPRPGGHHTPGTRVRAVIGSDPLVERMTMILVGWMQRAGSVTSERFVGESQAGPR